MLHGVASNHTRWSEFVEHTALKNNWNLLSLDLRGHGESMYYGTITRDIWARDLKAIIEHEQLRQVVMLGHSLGAEIALDYINTYPEDVQGLIMIDPVFPETLQGTLAWVKRYKYIVRGFTWIIQFFNLLGFRRRQLSKRDLQVLDNKTRKTLKENPEVNISDLYMNPFADLSYIPVANYLQDQFEVVRPLPALENIKFPVLVILSHGSSVSDRSGNENEIKRIRNSEIVMVECNHWPLTEQPEVVREIIDEWCQRIL
jgi:pimeloyl-ACP methyl ester carboxylesterase